MTKEIARLTQLAHLLEGLSPGQSLCSENLGGDAKKEIQNLLNDLGLNVMAQSVGCRQKNSTVLGYKISDQSHENLKQVEKIIEKLEQFSEVCRSKDINEVDDRVRDVFTSAQIKIVPEGWLDRRLLDALDRAHFGVVRTVLHLVERSRFPLTHQAIQNLNEIGQEHLSNLARRSPVLAQLNADLLRKACDAGHYRINHKEADVRVEAPTKLLNTLRAETKTPTMAKAVAVKADAVKTERSKNFYYFGANSGECVSYLEPQSDQIKKEDLALSLSRQFRGLGHDASSVAQHCLVATRLAFDMVGSLKTTDKADALLHVFLHDAHEAYMGDMPMPLKNMIKDMWQESSVKQGEKQDPVSVVEARLDVAIHHSFGLACPEDDVLAVVKKCDGLALALEMRDVFSVARRETFLKSGYTFPLARGDLTMTALTQKKAEKAYLTALKILQKLKAKPPHKQNLQKAKARIQSLAGLK